MIHGKQAKINGQSQSHGQSFKGAIESNLFSVKIYDVAQIARETTSYMLSKIGTHRALANRLYRAPRGQQNLLSPPLVHCSDTQPL